MHRYKIVSTTFVRDNGVGEHGMIQLLVCYPSFPRENLKGAKCLTTMAISYYKMSKGCSKIINYLKEYNLSECNVSFISFSYLLMVWCNLQLKKASIVFHLEAPLVNKLPRFPLWTKNRSSFPPRLPSFLFGAPPKFAKLCHFTCFILLTVYTMTILSIHTQFAVSWGRVGKTHCWSVHHFFYISFKSRSVNSLHKFVSLLNCKSFSSLTWSHSLNTQDYNTTAYLAWSIQWEQFNTQDDDLSLIGSYFKSITSSLQDAQH